MRGAQQIMRRCCQWRQNGLMEEVAAQGVKPKVRQQRGGRVAICRRAGTEVRVVGLTRRSQYNGTLRVVDYTQQSMEGNENERQLI